MNVLILFVACIALRPWGVPAGWTLTCVFAAISLLALEMQIATWSGLADLRSLAAANLALLAGSLIAWRLRTRGAARRPMSFVPPLPWLAAGLMAALVILLNVARPLEAADPYHLDRVAQIDRLGTLAYDLDATPKVNALGWTYELVLADLRQMPFVGPGLVRLHGVLGLGLWLLTLHVIRIDLPGGRQWCRAGALVVPVVFHQFVLVKNDLFGAAPALVALAWLVTRAADAPAREVAWAGWLAGLAIAVKLTSLPLALVMAGGVAAHRGGWRRLAPLALGGAIGAVSGGLAFTFVENARVYGSALAPFVEAGGADNANDTAAEVGLSAGRFAISLFDLGVVTRAWWPGRGGWGSTFGLPLVWALGVLALRYRQAPEARRAVWVAGAYFLVFAAVYADADLAHRLALAPGILLVAVAIHLVGEDDRFSARARAALAFAFAASAIQIVRSATLYLGM